MTALELSYVLQVSIGIIWSECLFTVCFVILSTCIYVTSSTRTKLANGKLQVAGDQWPIFLYANYMYDPEDLWNGLLCSGLLVVVCSDDEWSGISYWLVLPTKGVQTYLHISEFCRSGTQGNTFRKCLYPQDVLNYKGIHCLCCYAGMSNGDCWLFRTHFPSGPLCIDFSPSIFLHWPCYRLWMFLQFYSGDTRWPRGKGWSRPVDGMVESVSYL